MLRFSLSNLVAAATVSATTEDAAYPAAFVKSPQRPFMPYKSTTIASDQDVVVDLGGTTTLDVVGLIRANFTTAVVQGNATNVWTSPSYTQTVTLTRNPWNTRYQHAHRPVGFVYRYLRVAIPAQATTDGAAVFKLGGVWAGALTPAPRDFAETYTLGRIEPRMDVGPASRAWSQRLTMGEPRVAIRLKLDVITGTPPGKTDLLASWLDLQRQITAAQYVFALLEDSDPAQSYVVQAMSEPDWQIGTGSISTQSSFELQEMLGP